MTVLFTRAKALYERTRPWNDIVAFLLGIAWDWFSLRRIDELADNLTLLGYLAALAGLLILRRRVADAPEAWPRLHPHIAWVDWAVQFAFGGLLTAYAVYYTHSASLFRSFLYVAVLGGLMVANSFQEHRLRGDRLRLVLFCACAVSFLLFFIPIVLHWLGTIVFPVAALVAFGLTCGVAYLGHRDQWFVARNAPVWATMLFVMWFFSRIGLIPPVPLAMLGRGVFHEVHHAPTSWELTYECPTGWHPFRDDDSVFDLRDGDRVNVFTAVFAPRGTEIGVVHVWEQFVKGDGWVERNRLPFDVVGGRTAGYRGYTQKKNVSAGDWRVRVETEDGREIGRIYFEIVDGDPNEPREMCKRYVR